MHRNFVLVAKASGMGWIRVGRGVLVFSMQRLVPEAPWKHLSRCFSLPRFIWQQRASEQHALETRTQVQCSDKEILTLHVLTFLLLKQVVSLFFVICCTPLISSQLSQTTRWIFFLILPYCTVLLEYGIRPLGYGIQFFFKQLQVVIPHSCVSCIRITQALTSYLSCAWEIIYLWVGGEWVIVRRFILSGEKSLYFIFTFYRQEVLSI
jgi:hypothetical protein